MRNNRSRIAVLVISALVIISMICSLIAVLFPR